MQRDEDHRTIPNNPSGSQFPENLAAIEEEPGKSETDRTLGKRLSSGGRVLRIMRILLRKVRRCKFRKGVGYVLTLNDFSCCSGVEVPKVL
jgi:hypothetical protein